MGCQRGGSDDPASRRLLTELLLQMSSAADMDPAVYIFAATNRIQVGGQQQDPGRYQHDPCR